MKRVLIVAALLGVFACASMPAKQFAVAGEQAFHQALTAFDDAEKSACQPAPAQLNHCQSSAVPDALHQQISAKLSLLYDKNIRLSQGLVLWAHGGPVPPELASLLADVQAVRDLVASAGGALLEKAKALVQEAENLVAKVK